MNLFIVRDSIYDTLKAYIEENSDYKDVIFTRLIDSKSPCVVLSQTRNEPTGKTTDKRFMTRITNYDIDIYVKDDVGAKSSNEICEELANLVCEVMQNYYKLDGGITGEIPRFNDNPTSYAINTKFTCKYLIKDLKLY